MSTFELQDSWNRIISAVARKPPHWAILCRGTPGPHHQAALCHTVQKALSSPLAQCSLLHMLWKYLYPNCPVVPLGGGHAIGHNVHIKFPLCTRRSYVCQQDVSLPCVAG